VLRDKDQLGHFQPHQTHKILKHEKNAPST
jgi:hypothetical protein